MKRDILISTPARRYAKALLEVALKQRNFAKVLEELEGFQADLQEFLLLRQLFLSPAIAPAKKKKVLEDLSQKMGLEQLTFNFLSTLIHRDRLNLLEQVIVSSEQQFLERQGITVVEVVTARRLQADEESRMVAELEAFTGKKVRLENRVDPALIGGAITRIGTTVYDGSVQAQLEQIKVRMIATTDQHR